MLVAFLGLGRMGEPMAARLRTTGHDVVVWNRTPTKAARLLTLGARAADSPAAAAAHADVVITVLSDLAAVSEVVLSAAVPASACLVEMSTIGPTALADLTRRLPAGTAVVDAPVLGSVSRAASGDLVVLAGGHPEHVDRAAPVLSALGEVIRCGGPGSGAAAKLVANTALIAGMAVLGEAVDLAGATGLDREWTLDLLTRGPLAGAVHRARDTAAHFTVAQAAKDLALAAALHPTTPPLTTAALSALATRTPDAELSALTRTPC
ncbi:hypothetical protein GCM10023148_04340 [Actinokineospora soli]